ncbi:MAG: glycoside hydrolase family 32 protein [Chloroflexota bacterium]
MTNSDSPDYTSKVPFYTFPTTLEEQEAALATNPLMQRLNAYRKNYENDPHRPIYHYVNPEAMLNDPNGLCFWQGRWHLFYQAYPPEDTRQHWGHAVSDDLIHWRDLPYAIYPNPERCCFSGTALAEDDRVIAIYHGTMVGNMVATSSDPLLLNWEKVGNRAVIPFPEPRESAEYTVFDPCIWKKDGVYYSLSGGTLPNGPAGKQIRANFLLRSEDLEHWEYLHPFIEDDQYTIVGDDGACPYFWPIRQKDGTDKHILLFFSHMSGGQYLLGDYDTVRDKFVVTDGGLFNFGPSTPSGVHAPSAAPNPDGSVTVIFNMNPGKPTEDWNQIMTLPRRLTLDENGELRQEPDGDIESLRYAHKSVGNTRLPANQEVVLDSIEGNAMELKMELDPKDAQMLEINVLCSPNKEEFTRISYYKHRGFRRRFRVPNATALNANSDQLRNRPIRHESLITLDNTYSSTLPDVRSRAPETAPVHIEDDELLQLRIFIDRSVVEVFVNGKQCVSERVYPGREDSLGVSLRAQGADAELKSLDAWQMKNIYE